jgi:mannan endo-1,4-beta-mannosidase
MNRSFFYILILIALTPAFVEGQPARKQTSHVFLPNKAVPQLHPPVILKINTGTTDPSHLPHQGLLHSTTVFKTPTFQTNGKQLLDPCGKPVILKGVNKMAVFDHSDSLGLHYFPEIAKSGANCVRIAWEMKSNVNKQLITNSVSRLDQLISNAKNNKLIPIVGLWDYTNTTDGGFSKLNEYVKFWQKPAVLTMIRKHRAYLIINIANEAGMADGSEDSPDSLTKYAKGYGDAILQLRKSGINVPLMIDGTDRGKSLHCFAVKGPQMLNADPRHNLIFSFHPYWAKADTDANPTFIQSKFAEVSPLAITIVMGELAEYGAWPGSDTINICSSKGRVDYEQFVKRAEAAGMGWLIWEWGPGNQWKEPVTVQR